MNAYSKHLMTLDGKYLVFELNEKMCVNEKRKKNVSVDWQMSTAWIEF